MYQYGQYCPVARALELVGDRWTLLIVREFLTGTRHFNDFVRGLPGISRPLLAERLDRLERAGVVAKHERSQGRRRSEYQLTAAGEELLPVVETLMVWGAAWAFGEPREDELDPILLLWWMRGRARTSQLPQERVVVQFNFHGAQQGSYWLILQQDDVSVCLSDPGFDVDVLVSSDLALFFQLWLGRISYGEALRDHGLEVDAIPTLRRAFPGWFALSPSAATVRAATATRRAPA
jgi:DNA-binding HxlR family transcriptional regulator